MKTVSVKLNDAVANQLHLTAKRMRASKSVVVQKALKAFLSANGQNHDTGTCADLAGNLLGSLEGPGDLSFNPKHMEGFGK